MSARFAFEGLNSWNGLLEGISHDTHMGMEYRGLVLVVAHTPVQGPIAEAFEGKGVFLALIIADFEGRSCR